LPLLDNNNNNKYKNLKNDKICILTDMAIPVDRKATQKEAEKELSTRVYLLRCNK
jgi:hypothetical protein